LLLPSRIRFSLEPVLIQWTDWELPNA